MAAMNSYCEKNHDASSRPAVPGAAAARALKDMSIAKEAVCFMGFPESLVQLAIDVQRLDRSGSDFTDVTQLYLVVEEIFQNPAKQDEYANKLHAHSTQKETAHKGEKNTHRDNSAANEEPAPQHSAAEMLEITSSAELSRSSLMQKKVRALKKENQLLKKRGVCRICKQTKLAASGTTFLPCGHFISCEVCSEMFDDCPACGKTIRGTVRTFLS